MDIAPIVKAIRAYDAEEWELFIREWVKGLDQYEKVEKLGGPGDLGRDVIGLCSARACEGEWDNYQCKHYEKPLGVSRACEDAGKIIFHAYRGEFSAPRRYFFVAPRGVSIDLREKLLNPSQFKSEVISTWNSRVATKIAAGQDHKLEKDLKQYVEAYDFSTFTFASIRGARSGA
jgi:hypothetical protein